MNHMGSDLHKSYSYIVVLDDNDTLIDQRRVVHFVVTRHLTDAWVVQQLREATPFGVKPRLLIQDRDESSEKRSGGWSRGRASTFC